MNKIAEQLKAAGYDIEDAQADAMYATSEPLFKLGDVVKLKSGGPLMTVIRLDLYDMVRVLVCDEAGFREASVPAAGLEMKRPNPTEDMTSAP